MYTVIKKFEELSVYELYDIMKARTDIFVVEQNCPYYELDNKDQNAVHVTLYDDDHKILAYLRLLKPNVSFPEASIGRVISVVRNQGYAKLLLQTGIDYIEKEWGETSIHIAAQHYAKRVYESVGFKQCSEPFMDDGIEHIEMIYRK